MASGWKRRFDELIPLPRGRQLVTLEDAAKYFQKLPAAEQQIAEWQAAVEAPALGRRAQRPDHDGAHWRHEGIETRLRSGV